MDLAKLRAFIVVGTELNFRKSAEILGMSQPPLSRLIASLEDDLGTKLLERTTRRVKLTGPGIYLLTEGRRIVSEAEALEKEVRNIAKLKSGSLQIGFSKTTFLANFPQIVNEFKDRFPRIKLELHHATPSEVIKGLRSGKIDVGFVEGHLNAIGLENILLKEVAMGALLPKKHPLAKLKEIEFKDLKNDTIILHPRKESENFFDSMEHLFRASGITPRTYIKKASESCPILVATGKGISITIPGSHNLVSDETKFVPIKKLQLSVAALWPKENLNPSLKSFISFVAEGRSVQCRDPECLIDAITL